METKQQNCFMNKNIKIKYFAYCRKSSEDSSRQIASIKDQIDSLSGIIERENIELVTKPFTEEKSAKEPGRPVFNNLLDRIEKGEANAILCWDIDRLYRNPIDEGRLRWMLQKGIIQTIRTPYRQFYPEDAGLLMGVEGGRATDYVIRLSKNVKRGFKGKLAKGWRPCSSPIGYINIGDDGNKTIAPDPQTFDLVKQMWDLFLTGSYSVSQIKEIATNKWGLRTKIKRKLGGKPLSMSHMYKIFGDSFYYGYFWWKNPETGEKELYKGGHKPMISEKEYWRAQALLGKKGKPQPKTREFAFTGIIQCGECGGMITAEEKNQIICTNCKHKFSYDNKTSCPKCDTDILEMKSPTILNYTYYHCTKRKSPKCAQKSVRLEDLEKQFNETLDKITIDDDYLKLALDYLNEKQDSEVSCAKTIEQSLLDAYSNCQTRITNLNKEYTSPQNANYNLYSPEEFKELKNDLLKERSNIEQELKDVKNKIDESLELSEKTFNFCTYAKYHFNTGTLQTKREIFSSIGSNMTLTDKKLSINLINPYLLIEKEMSSIKKQYAMLEPTKNGFNKRKGAVFAASISTWRGL